MSVPAASPPASKLILKVDGMSCGHCAATLTKSLLGVDGVVGAEVSHAAGRAVISYTGKARPARYREAVASAGFTAVSESDGATTAGREAKRARNELRLLLWSLLWTAPVLAIHYLPGLQHQAWSTWAIFICASVLQPTSAVTYYRGAIASLKQRVAGMDVLVSIGVLSGYTYATLSVIFPSRFQAHSMEFFEAATLLICFIRFGKWIEIRSRARAAGAMEALLTLAPKTARRLGLDGATTEVDVSQIIPGERLAVLPGDAFPVDGTVKEGTSAANESLISGESLPVPKGPGDRVVAGSTNEGGRLVIEAVGVGADTAVARIVEMVENAQSNKAPMQRLADRISNVFVPLVVSVAVASGLYWGLVVGAPGHRVLTHVISVLVIACPCALGIAVPAAIMIGSAAGLRKGILVKNGAALERLNTLTRMVFDKTGTLTLGRPALANVILTVGVTENEALAMLARLARDSNHPLSRAALAACESRSVAAAPFEGRFTEVAGRGTRLENRETTLLFGSRTLMDEQGIAVSGLAPAVEKERERGASLSYLARDGNVLAAFSFRDPLRPEARALIASLKAHGVAPVMISGDHETAARAIAGEAGIDEVYASASPADKITRVKEWQAAGERVGMVGDGINDAPALAQADVSIAVGGGTDVAKETGDLVLMSGGIENLRRALELSRRTRRGIHQNLFVSLIYNAIGIPLAAGLAVVLWPESGLVLPPSFAALAMVLSDASVALNSARLAAELRGV